MNLPKDPVMLLSVVNTQLRDKYSNLDLLCEAHEISRMELEKKLAKINYVYNQQQNQFK